MVAGSSALLRSLFNGPTLLLTAGVIVPALVPSFFGWLSGLVAIPVFCLLVLHGEGTGNIYIRNSILLALAVAFILRLVPSALFALSLFPAGYSLARSARLKEGPWQAGARACLVLGGSWLLYWAGYGMLAGFNPYVQLLQLLDAGFAHTYEVYAANTEMPAEALLQLQQLVNSLREIVPRVMPGMLISTVLVTVWLNMLAGISLVEKLKPGMLPWPPYGQWRLPEQLVWPLIAAALLLFVGSDTLAGIAMNTVLVCGLLFFFQGLAVFVHFLDKWKVPPYLRLVIYVILVLQSYGLLLLAVAGLADIWFDFRSRGESANRNDNDKVG